VEKLDDSNERMRKKMKELENTVRNEVDRLDESSD